MSSKTKKAKKGTALDTGRLDERMWRVNQRAHKFADKRKAAAKGACRGKVAY